MKFHPLVILLALLLLVNRSFAQGDTTRFLDGHTEAIGTIELSSDHALVLTGAPDGRLNIWRTASGELVRRLEHRSGILDAHFSPDGLHVLTVTAERVAEWNIETGSPIDTIVPYIGPSGAAEYSRDGTRIAVAYSSTIVFYDRTNRREIVRTNVSAENARVERIRYMPDDRSVAWSGYDTRGPQVYIPRVAIHQEGSGVRMPSIELPAGRGQIGRLDVAPTHVAMSSRHTGGVFVVSLETGRPLFRVIGSDTMQGLRLFRGGRYLLVALGNVLEVYDVLSGNGLGLRFFKHPVISALDVSEDGSLVAIGRGTRAELWGQFDRGSRADNDPAQRRLVWREDSDGLAFDIGVDRLSEIRVRVTDMIGREISRATHRTFDNAKWLRVEPPASNGAYLVVVDVDGFRESRIWRYRAP